MNILTAEEVKGIEQFFQLSQENLLKIMGRYLKSKYETVYYTKEYVAAVGDIPVALVAHLDTVFDKPPVDIFYDRVKNVMWSPDGLGADDRAGVYAIVQLIKKGLRPTIIFTTDEEKGALGAEALIMDHPTAITDLKYIVQLDRRGNSDCVFYNCNNLEFEDFIEEYGFVTTYGSFSDISVICPAWGIAGVNLSIGYVDEHSYSELLYVGSMLATIKKVEKMLKEAKLEKIKSFEYIPLITMPVSGSNYDFGWDPSYGIGKNLWKSWHMNKDEVDICAHCHKQDYEHNLVPVKDLGGNSIFMCADCIVNCNYVGWCLNCGEAYVLTAEDQDKDRAVCYDCEGEINGNN